MELLIIYGSVRTQREGIKAVRYIEKHLHERGHEVRVADPMQLQLPLLEKMYKEYEKGEAPQAMEELAQAIKRADGYVIVTGEYNHQIPPALTNLMDHYMQEYFFKPSAIVSYSAGNFGGVRAAMAMRILLAELGTPSIPSIFSISKIQEFTEDGTPNDEHYDKNVGRFLDEYEWYLEAYKNQREKGTPY